MPANSANAVVDALRRRRAAVEYWYFSVRAGELAFLVDFIARRRPKPTVEIRVSAWVRGKGEVIHDVKVGLDGVGPIATESGEFDAKASVGSVGGYSWDLTWDLGPWLLDPRPLIGRLTHFTDVELVAFPNVTFDGWVDVRGERLPVTGRAGTVHHYWGRRLLDGWIWVSAVDFPDEPRRRLEAFKGVTRTWGYGPGIPFGYAWTTDGTREDLTFAPFNGFVRLHDGVRAGDDLAAGGGPARARMSSRRYLGGRHTLEVSCPVASLNDLGEGIHQTLLADAVFDGLAAAPGSVEFEFRRR